MLRFLQLPLWMLQSAGPALVKVSELMELRESGVNRPFPALTTSRQDWRESILPAVHRFRPFSSCWAFLVAQKGKRFRGAVNKGSRRTPAKRCEQPESFDDVSAGHRAGA
ncbi:hypothetical protein AAFF_G00396560 [Aldrovandia affinis]|uniref:Secreted protein n=1 Tax=Aldrovandia affinis TaxID=143900 RepID=A0AAD7SDF3_9TELE|nr:hypothetical protein AAFF_G00396560 [Aldrovandia affinis]